MSRMSCCIFPSVSTGILDAFTLRFKDAHMEAHFCKQHVQEANALLVQLSLLLCFAATLEFVSWGYTCAVDCTQSSGTLIAPVVLLACAIALVIIRWILGAGKRLVQLRGAVQHRFETIVVAALVVCMFCTPLMHPWYRVHFLDDERSRVDPASSDARLHLSWICILVTPHCVMPIRWCVVWPVHISCIVMYAVCSLPVGGHEHSKLFSLSGVFLFTYMLYVTILARRRAEVNERLLFVSKAYPEKQASQPRKDSSSSCNDTGVFQEQSAFKNKGNQVHQIVDQIMNRQSLPRQTNSAPAVLAQNFMKQMPVCEASSGDCLPPDAVVWVEDKAMPMPLLAVQPGDKVMCYDRLSMCMKYAKVTSKKVQDSQVKWVTIALADGSSMLMTADHPVHRESEKESRKTFAIKAAKLRPGKDSIMVLKMVPVLVEKVTSMVSKDSSTPLARVALSVQHEDRHSIFVGAPGQNPSIAVGSAGVDALSYRSSELDSFREKMNVKNTFIHGHAPLAEEIPNFRRSNSDPCLHTGNTDDNRAFVLDVVPVAPGNIDDDRAFVLDVVPVAPFQPVQVHLASRQRIGDQDLSDYSSSLMSGDIIMPAIDGQPCRVTSVLQVREEGLASIGSAMHWQGECRTCVFHAKGQHKLRNCTMGSLCSFCHEDHEYKKKRGKGGGRGQL